MLSLIQARSLTRELLVVVTSDHGEEFGEHGGFNHAKHLYREVIQVPLVLWQPGRVPAGTRVNQPVSNAAIAATVLTLLDADPAPFVVPSLQPLWEGTRSDFAPPVAALKRSPRRGRINQGSMRSVVDGAWHYIEQDGRGFELFDWIADPRERTDLATTPPAPAISHRLRTHLK
jgi:arylsulfatase A-like enzyme